ncbi:hypothetical protein ACFQH6_03595 [Halobacteriaceae archaeon GCM10025711]
MTEDSGQQSDPATSQNQDDGQEPEEQEAEGLTKRVNITMPPAQHDKLKAFANGEGMSFSRFVRRGCEELRVRSERGGAAREYQPLVQKLDRLEELLSTVVDQVEEVDQRVERLERHPGPPAEQVADELLGEFYDGSEKSIVELADEVDREVPEVQRGLKELSKSFAIVRKEPENTDTGSTRYQMRGKNDEE